MPRGLNTWRSSCITGSPKAKPTIVAAMVVVVYSELAGSSRGLSTSSGMAASSAGAKNCVRQDSKKVITKRPQ